MTAYYVDISTVAAFNTRNGLSSGACWYGLAGIHAFIQIATAGDVCYVSHDGTEKDCREWKDCGHGGTTGAFVAGEVVDDGEGNTAIFGEDTGSTIMYEELSGSFAATDTITGQTSGAFCVLGAAPDSRQAAIDPDSGNNAGSYDGGFIRLIGVNDSWARDGSRVILDGNSDADIDYGIYCYPGRWWIESFEVKYVASQGIRFYGSASVCINCYAHNCSSAGFYLYYADYSVFALCISENNGTSGFAFGTNADVCDLIFCLARGNTDEGFTLAGGISHLYGCISHGHSSGNGIDGGEGVRCFNCIMDGNSQGFDNNTSNIYFSYLVGCRLTNNTNGIDVNNTFGFAMGCFFNDNTSDIVNDTNSLFLHLMNRGALANEALIDGIPTSLTGGESNLRSATGNDEGYSDLATDDFNLTATAKMRGDTGDTTNLEIDLET